MQIYAVPYQNNSCCKRYLAIIKKSIINNIMIKSHTILNLVWETLWYSPLLAFQEYIITGKEITKLELKTLFKLVNAVLYD